MSVIQKLVSLRHFEKVKSLFEVETVDKLKDKLRALEQKNKANNDYIGEDKESRQSTSLLTSIQSVALDNSPKMEFLTLL